MSRVSDICVASALSFPRKKDYSRARHVITEFNSPGHNICGKKWRHSATARKKEIQRGILGKGAGGCLIRIQYYGPVSMLFSQFPDAIEDYVPTASLD